MRKAKEFDSKTEEYLQWEAVERLPRIPLEGKIDVTYRCNNDCLHCWLKAPSNVRESSKEISCEKIKNIVLQAHKMGCRSWSLSGGEPMLRPDFIEIVNFIIHHASSCFLNTNGTLITPKIARTLKRKCISTVAIYGATAEVHDRITRNPGSFEQVMNGSRYLREAGANFTVQLIPMRDNYHQLDEMKRLAKSLSKYYKIGSPWLYLSASGCLQKNKEILQQRLPPEESIKLDEPDLTANDALEENYNCQAKSMLKKGYLFSACIDARRDFHIDPYGGLTFCSYVKDPQMRYDLTHGSFKNGWEDFIPSLASRVKMTKEYLRACGSCGLRKQCRWCAVYAFLEHRRFSAKIDYLCRAAETREKFENNWKAKHRKFFYVAGVTLQIETDLEMGENTFHPKFKPFEVDCPGSDLISIRHHFSIPNFDRQNLGNEVCLKPPWTIYRRGRSWIYLGISPRKRDKTIQCLAVFNHDHTRCRIYNQGGGDFLRGEGESLTFFPTDQILLARVLADREGFFLHASGVILGGKGMLFVGHSGAGKSTMVKMLRGKVKILCDDRIIVRKHGGFFKIHGTWSHGEVPDVAPDAAKLRAIFFLHQAKENRLERIRDKKRISAVLLDCLIQPLVTADWWAKTLAVIGQVAGVVPCYDLYFDKSGRIVPLLKRL